MSSQEIQDIIKQHLPVKKQEKNKFGEVFTPQSLIEEMLNKLPKSVWENPDLKWLDPANGIGNFPMIAFEKLNEGLKEVDGYKDDGKRKKHIIKNMLYMVELNPNNVAVSRKIFGKDANIFCGSFLEDGWKREFDVDKFDVIMGNPPYNADKKGGKGVAKGGNDLYPKFVLKSIENLSINKYLLFVHPPRWRAPYKKGEIKKLQNMLLKEKQLLFLKMFGVKETKKIFNVSVRVDYYILQNKENTKTTEVIDELGEKHLLELNKIPFLPNYAYKEINKILTTEEKGIDVIYSSSIYDTRKLKETKTSEYKYPVLHSIKQNGKKIIYFTNIQHKQHFGVPKVIIIKGLYAYGYNDFKGEYGMSSYSFGLPIHSKKEGELILQAIEKSGFKTIYAATKWKSGFTDQNMFKYFKPDFYKYFLDDKILTTEDKGIYNYFLDDKILTTEDKGIDVIYSRSLYGTDKPNVKEPKTSEYKYPVVHSINKKGITYWYSNDNTKGHYGVPKVILNFNRHQYSHSEQNDYEGKYGMSQISFGIPIKSKKEGDLILKAIQTSKFKKIIAATKWGAFQTDYRMFKYFKPDFYKYFLDDT